MRLIDADDVKDLINGLDSLPWEEECGELVDALPTAYDIDKVVEQLSKKAYNCGSHINIYGEKAEWMAEGYYGAIEIVKKGGVNNE